jgi:hypothetical protein
LQNPVGFIAYSDAVLVPHEPTNAFYFIIIMLFSPTPDRISTQKPYVCVCPSERQPVGPP